MSSSDEYFRELRRKEEWERNQQAAEDLTGPGSPYAASRGSSRTPRSSGSSGCGCAGWGCLVFVAVAALGGWLFYSEFRQRDDVRTVTAILCGKEEDGRDRLIRTSEGDFRLGDVPDSTAAEQYDALRTGGVYDISYQGMEMPLLPRPVTRGVTPVADGAQSRNLGSCPADS
ncbi:hypothetical protein [Streptomyces yangpuensis]|uniref:hypothetical protein n=1 Tax=Streptomyces yangpuensis TaxID=1648182 RepID=UPI00381F732A